MADKKISALTAATTPLAGTEVLPVVQGSTTVKVSVNNLTLGRAVEANSLTLNADGLTILASEAYSYLYSSGGIGLSARVRFRTVYTGGGSGYGGSFELESRTSSNVWNTGALTVTDAGNVSTTGNFVVGTAGKGIDFSANTHAAGMTSELLNDYEEGTWTPTISSTSGTITSYTINSARYTKVGRLVNLIVQFAITNNGTGAGAIFIQGFPFTNAVATCGTTYNQSTGEIGSVSVSTSATDGYIAKYDGTYPVATGQTLQFNLTHIV